MAPYCQEDEEKEAQEEAQNWRYKGQKEMSLLRAIPLEKLSPWEPLKNGLIRARSPREFMSFLCKLYHLTY